MEITSQQLISELTTTQWVVLKDSLDAECQRLRNQVADCLGRNEWEQGKILNQVERQKQDLSNCVGYIIEAKLEEAKHERSA
jgi:hypothetical protein